jgi:putative colanic acid biosynthesis acetyltransferase WcaF
MKKVNLGAFTNSGYKPGGFPRRAFWYITSLLFFKTAIPYPGVVKRFLLACFGAKVGAATVIKPRVTIKYPWFLEIGAHVWIGENVWIDNLAKVAIAGNVCISQGAVILTGNHDYKKTTFDLRLAPVIIEEGSWIGACAVVAPGVTVKTHTVLTVGSVLLQDTQPYGIYQGNPAQMVRSREIA